MTYRNFISLICFSVIFFFAAISVNAGPADKKPLFYWKFSTMAPSGSGWVKHMEEMVLPVVDEASNHEIYIKNYWGGVLGDDKEILKKIKDGKLDGTGLSAQGTIMACREMSVLELPFLFNDFDEVDYIKEKMSGTFDDILKKHNFFLMAWVDQDFDQIYSKSFSMATVNHFKNATFFTWYGPVEEELLKEFGANMIKTEVPEAASRFRGEKVDSCIAPALWAVAIQLYSTARYINPLKIRYSPGIIIISLDPWNRLPQRHRDKFFELRPDLMKKYCQAVRKDNEKALNAMYEYGLQKVEVRPQEALLMKMKSKAVWEKLSGQMYPPELLNQITALLEEYRKSKER